METGHATLATSLPRLTGATMGLTHVKVQIANPEQSDDRITIDFLVDSGAMYSLVPATILREFVLANGEVV